jgi:hypothetical protein
VAVESLAPRALSEEEHRELLVLCHAHRFVGTHRRVAVAKGAPRDRWGFLKDSLDSDVLVKGPIFDFCKKVYGTTIPFSRLQFNRNLQSTRHIDRNLGDSYVLLAGDFTKGALCLESGEAFDQKGVPHRIPLGVPHWTLPFKGTRFAVVFYASPKEQPVNVDASQKRSLPSSSKSAPSRGLPPRLGYLLGCLWNHAYAQQTSGTRGRERFP